MTLHALPRAALSLAALAALTACAQRVAPATADALLDALFAPPTAAERAAVEAEWAARDTGAHGVRVEAEWAARDTGAHGVRVEAERSGEKGRTLVLSHTVGGVRHYGAVRIPAGAAGRKLPVLVVAHGGERGATGWQFVRSGPLAEEWVQVVPSFRSERLMVSPFRWHRSQGPASPWDRDVDDTMALLSTVLARVPEADSGRVAVLGRSRGAGVALLMGVRDPRVKGVVTFAGPTDFLLPEVRRLAARAIRSRIPRLPGAGYLANRVLFPLRDGKVPLPWARQELLRRSAAHFAHRLPAVQAHHGTADDEVDVAHGDRLDQAMRALGRTAPRWEYHRYPGGGHRPGTLHGSQPRMEAFLQRTAGLPTP